MSFPATPTNGQTAVINNITYSYNATTNAWSRVLITPSGLTSTNAVYTISNCTAASSTYTGALVVAGGAGVGGALYAGSVYAAGAQLLPTTIQEFTASAAQTTFAISGGYTPGQVQVTANGISLSSVDFTATNGSTVVLNIPRNSGDIIRVVASQGFGVSSQQAYNLSQLTAIAPGQSVFSANYNTNTVQVFLNGLLLSTTQYTASNGTTIVLNPATAATVYVGSPVGVISFNSVSLSNAISSSGGTINGTLNVIGTLQNNGVSVNGMALAMSVAMGM